MVTTRQFGLWDSPITPDELTGRSVVLSQVRVEGKTTWWVEGRPKQGGRNVLLRRTRLGVTEEVLPMIEDTTLPDVRTRVHEYGGRAYAVAEGIVVFSHAGDGRVYRYDLSHPSDGVVPLTELADRRYGDFELDLVRGLVYAVCEDHTVVGEATNYLVRIPLDGSGAREPDRVVTVFSNSDFAIAPTLSPDGTTLAWITWNHPHMPWTRSQLHVGSLDFDGSIVHDHTLIDEEEVCVYEPRWTLTGDLIHVDDSTGWANLYRTEGFAWREGDTATSWTTRLRSRRLHPANRAFSHPHWQLGLHSYDNLDEDHLICSWAEDGLWHLGSIRLDNGQLEHWDIGWWPAGNVASDLGRVVLLADSPEQTPSIIEVTAGQTSVLRTSTYAELDSDLISRAESISWPTRDGEVAHGFFYSPQNPGFTAPTDDRPPLIVMVHGGPTAAARPGLSLEKQYWTSRGFAVLDVNHRGSSGWGRAYRARLNGHWGEMDIDDCADGVQYLVDADLIDPKQVAIRGASAGGFTTLAALARGSVFTAGTALYGVADLRTLSAETHKFESRYLGRLLGSSDPADPVYAERSPINLIEQITSPLLLLHGREDTVVPFSQALHMKNALAGLGRVVELKLYDGEGHGFVKAETVADAIETERVFYLTAWAISQP
ncbi:MAG: prolyl oligopeptidase family serine peptidase [Actinomycetaceae bacterium]|nr:prolyl oligopeptidase family serine peptidase [Actinomycetaceae bacterium]